MLQTKDWEALKTITTEDSPILFSPYVFIDSTITKPLTVNQLIHFTNNNIAIHWANEDATGDSLLLSIPAYFQRYINNRNYTQSDTVAINYAIGNGNSSDNVKGFLLNTDFVEYHFRGTSINGGLDWRSLRLYFRTLEKNKFRLVGVIQNQWTS